MSSLMAADQDLGFRYTPPRKRKGSKIGWTERYRPLPQDRWLSLAVTFFEPPDLTFDARAGSGARQRTIGARATTCRDDLQTIAFTRLAVVAAADMFEHHIQARFDAIVLWLALEYALRDSAGLGVAKRFGMDALAAHRSMS